ncbi:tetratricopeptide repeat protein [Gelidibacter salicanalis]|uniref:Tetratricopeptide repeat protein n=1 Tax=Gelidibacter salicanalis TaxID=291193 RepID=A0A934NKN3_9FLAO|nr:tetratricopeptide repeat protein [Gelidibacter salicanalis]MBJ7881492.1 tetratricopeptide repeat protein [Gelidibacter salicanalis]
MPKFCSVLSIVLISWSMQAQFARLKLADSLYVHGNYAQSITVFKSIELQDQVYEKLAKAYIALGNYDEALENYKRASQASPEDALLKYDYAKLLARSKKLKSAEVLLNELVYLDYRNPNYHYELGLVMEQQGDSTAMNRFHSAFNLDKTHQKAIHKIAKHLLVKRHHDASLKYINIGLESYANNTELINLKALNYYWKQDYQAAAQWFEKLLDLGENSQFIHEKLSFCYAETLQYEKAIVYAKRAVDFDLNNTTNLYILGRLYEKINDFASAEEWLTKALIIMDQPLHVEYTTLATVLNQQKKHKEAMAALQNAIKEDPKDERAQFFLVRTKDEYFADTDSKIKAYEVFKERFPKSVFGFFADKRLRELKEEKFMKSE